MDIPTQNILDIASYFIALESTIRQKFLPAIVYQNTSNALKRELALLVCLGADIHVYSHPFKSDYN